jgi:hypothetical protein
MQQPLAEALLKAVDASSDRRLGDVRRAALMRLRVSTTARKVWISARFMSLKFEIVE